MAFVIRTKEEKEVLEHFAGVFALLYPLTFKEVFSQTIDYVVERIYNNYALQARKLMDEMCYFNRYLFRCSLLFRL